ncbi:MAG: hypothetical protein QXP36_12305, partial [Conexivisphaerales archaeon]
SSDKVQYYLPRESNVNLEDIRNKIVSEIQIIKGEIKEDKEPSKAETKEEKKENNVLQEKKKRAIA